MIYIKRANLENLQEYIGDLINSNNQQLAFELPEKWLCRNSCHGCQFNLGGVECEKEAD